MSRMSRTILAAAAVASLLGAVPALAQQDATPTQAKAVDEKAFKADAPGLYANADLSYVLTSGNSNAKSLAFKGDVTGWERNRFSGIDNRWLVDTGLTVLAPYKELDQGLSVSLVFSFAPPKKS